MVTTNAFVTTCEPWCSCWTSGSSTLTLATLARCKSSLISPTLYVHACSVHSAAQGHHTHAHTCSQHGSPYTHLDQLVFNIEDYLGTLHALHRTCSSPSCMLCTVVSGIVPHTAGVSSMCGWRAQASQARHKTTWRLKTSSDVFSPAFGSSSSFIDA